MNDMLNPTWVAVREHWLSQFAFAGPSEKFDAEQAIDDWLEGVKSYVWDEREWAKPQYLGPDQGHYEDCCGWEDCYCASYPNPYRKESEDV